MGRVVPVIIAAAVLAVLAWFLAASAREEPEPRSVHGDLLAWEPGRGLQPEERDFYLRTPEPLTGARRRELAVRYGVTFTEALPGFGYVIRRQPGSTAARISGLDGEPDVSVHHIGPDNRRSPGLKPAGTAGFSADELLKLGSRDGRTIPLLVSFRHGVPEAAQETRLTLADEPLPERRTGAGGRLIWRVEMTPDNLERLLEDPRVRWVAPEGPPPQTDLGEAVPGVGDSGALTGPGVTVAQVEPCAAMTAHQGFGGRMVRHAPPDELCQLVVAELSGPATTRGFDRSSFEPSWPLWLDEDGDGVGDTCVWTGSTTPCPSGTLPPADADWEPLQIDTIISPYFPLFVSRPGETDLSTEHYRLCTNRAEAPGCPDLGQGEFRLKPVPATDPLLGEELSGYVAVHHPTHVAGIMIGDGSGDEHDPPSVGIAEQAGIRGFAVNRAGSNAFSTYDDAMTYDVQVANNSWGLLHGFSPVGANFWLAQFYDSLASGRLADGSDNAFDRRLLVVGSVGNAGLDRSTGQERFSSARLGNSSKNSIAVANLDKSSNLAADSSRGPTKDDRLTPLIGAIGGRDGTDQDRIRSTFPAGYDHMYGTSQAAPLVAATAAMVADRYQPICSGSGLSGVSAGQSTMNPALVRALLLHTADSLGQPGPDYRTGYGRLNAAAAMAFAEATRFQTHDITTGYVEYLVDVDGAQLEPDGSLKVTLAWDDLPWPGLLAPSPDHGLLQTDLDLELIAPSGRRYLPWILDPDTPAAPARTHDHVVLAPVPESNRDRRNTVEQVVVDQPAIGVWRFRVRSNHPFGTEPEPQSFSLVSRGLGNGSCAAMAPRVVRHAIVAPSNEFLFRLLWIALVIIALLLLVIWRETTEPPPQHDAPSFPISLGRMLLFIAMLVLVFLTLYVWPLGILLWGGLALVAVLALAIYFYSVNWP